MAWSRPLAIAGVVLVSLTSAFVARAGEPLTASRDGDPPPGVAACLALAPTQMGDCFRTMSTPPPGPGVPIRVAACLALPVGQQRTNCFRNLAPPAVAACLAMPTRTQRAGCFRKLVPARVAACLALSTRQQRLSCLRKLPGP